MLHSQVPGFCSNGINLQSGVAVRVWGNSCITAVRNVSQTAVHQFALGRITQRKQRIMTQSLLPLLGAAAGAMVQVLLIAAVGYVCAKRPKDPGPLLAPDALGAISRVANDVFLPCLSCAVLGANINVANLKGDWVLLPAGVVATALGYAVADLTAYVLRPTPALKPALRVAIAHPNAFALPLLLLQYLCERPSVNEEFGGEEDTCVSEAAASLCLYLTAWHFVFWSYAYVTLEDAARARQARSRAETAKLWAKRLFLQPNMIGMYAGIIIGATPLRRLLFRGDSPLRPVGLAIETLGQPVIAVTVMIMAAALANGQARRRRSKREFSSVNGSPGAAPEERDAATAAWFILARLVIVPVIAYPVFSVIALPGGKMTTLIILLELAMPGAQTVLVTLNAVGSGHVAEEIAPWYFLQYATAVVTLTAFTVWALHIVYR